MTKILLFDIETAPNLSYVWGKYEQDVLDVKDHWYMLCFAAKWLDKKKVLTSSLPDFSLYKKDPLNDKEVVKKLWELLDEADIVIAHNGDAFDIRKTNARFIKHGLKAPSSYKTIDTLKVARKYFKFDSNKLDDLGHYLNIGRKINTGGWALWAGCMKGDMKSWKKMLKYNRRDVILLEEVYLKLRPYMTNHPNINITPEIEDACPTCGSRNLIRRGYHIRKTNKARRYQCNDCGSWSQGKVEYSLKKV